MTGEVEQRLAERGLLIEEYPDFARDAQPGTVGFVGVVQAHPGVRAVAYVGTGTPPDQRDRFAEWVERKIDNYLECGPLRDGWERRSSDEGWQLWARPDDLETVEPDMMPDGHPLI